MKRFILVTVFMISLAVVFSSLQNGKAPEQTTKEEHSVSKPKNIVLMIGDGMGVSQIYAGMTVSKEPLVFEQFQNIGFQKTHSKDSYITDSGASGTAIATGKKTNNGHIAVTPSGEELTTILELAEKHGLSTGLASTSSIVHATPAAFITHNKDRNNYEDLAADFLETDIDVFIGGGKESFDDREDGRDLIQALKSDDYQVLTEMDEINKVREGKLAGFTAEGHNPRYSEGRGDMLPEATQTALDILDNNQEGFFLMVEASQIDWGGHDNNTDYIVEE
ncbi:MAG: alkaline phosphatase, partial [Bacteroidales bacterium]